MQVFLRLPHGPTVEDALVGDAELADCVVRYRRGFDVLPASSGTAAMGDLGAGRRERLLEGLSRLGERYDIVVADGAAGIGPDVLGIAAAADHVLVVTTPEPAAVTDAYGLIKAVGGWADGAGAELSTPELVINRARGVDEARATAHKLRAVCERFLARSPRMTGWLPASQVVALAAARQAPFVTGETDAADGGRRALLASCVTRIGDRLEALLPRSAALSPR